MASRIMLGATLALVLAACATGHREGVADAAVDPGEDLDGAGDLTPDPDALEDPPAEPEPDALPDVDPADPPAEPQDDGATDAAEDAAADPEEEDPPADPGDDPPDDPADASPDTGGPLPDLVVEDITRDTSYYRVQYCNRGTATSTSTFLVSITNVGTGSSFESNPMYPFTVPAVGTCAWTGGFTCSLIGPGCTASLSVRATVDTRDTVAESREDNNEHTVSF